MGVNNYRYNILYRDLWRWQAIGMNFTSRFPVVVNIGNRFSVAHESASALGQGSEI